jgi:hypothetical protein
MFKIRYTLQCIKKFHTTVVHSFLYNSCSQLSVQRTVTAADSPMLFGTVISLDASMNITSVNQENPRLITVR